MLFVNFGVLIILYVVKMYMFYYILNIFFFLKIECVGVKWGLVFNVLEFYWYKILLLFNFYG